MRIIKLSSDDEEMGTSDEVTRYLTVTLMKRSRYGQFGISWAKRSMPDVRRGTLLIFSYKTQCMYAARAQGEVVIDGRKNLRTYIPLSMETVEPIEGSLGDFEEAIWKNSGFRKSLRATRHWPELPDSCESFATRYFGLRQRPGPMLKSTYDLLKSDLEIELRQLYYDAGEELSYWGKYYWRSLKRRGGLGAAVHMLRPRTSVDTHAGLQRLIDAGRARELSVEAIILRKEFRSLFSAEELKEARRRLDALPAPRVEDTPAEDNFPDTLNGSEWYLEGQRKKVWVNAVERNRKARRACLAHHGYACRVCGIEFVKIYGEIGKQFIHVHHKLPVGTKERQYKIRPKKDLCPVCPNCHAMLHAKRPPLTVPRLRRIWEAERARRIAKAQVP